MFEKINKWFNGSKEEVYELPKRYNRLDVDIITRTQMGIRMNSIAIHYDINIDTVINHCRYNDMPNCYVKGTTPFYRVYKRITGNDISNKVIIERNKKIEKLMSNIKRKK
jgi:hypothetical protein